MTVYINYIYNHIYGNYLTDVHIYNNIIAINSYRLTKIHSKYLAFKLCFTQERSVNRILT